MGRITMVEFTNKEVKPWNLRVFVNKVISLCRDDTYAGIRVSRVIDHLDVPTINNNLAKFAKESNIYHYDFKTCTNIDINRKTLRPEIIYYGRDKFNGKHMLLLTVCEPYKVIGFSYRESGVRPVYTFNLDNNSGVGELVVIDENVDGFIMKLTLVTDVVEELTFTVHGRNISYTSDTNVDQRRKFEFPLNFRVEYKSVITDVVICGVGERGKVISIITNRNLNNMEIFEVPQDNQKVEELFKKLNNNGVKAITVYGSVYIFNSMCNKYHINFVFRLNDDGSVISIKSK